MKTCVLAMLLTILGSGCGTTWTPTEKGAVAGYVVGSGVGAGIGAARAPRSAQTEWLNGGNPESPLSMLGGHEPMTVAPAGCKAGVK